MLFPKGLSLIDGSALACHPLIAYTADACNIWRSCADIQSHANTLNTFTPIHLYTEIVMAYMCSYVTTQTRMQIGSTCAQKPKPSPAPSPSQGCCVPGHPYHFIKGSHCVETNECHFGDIQNPGLCPSKFNFINRVDHIQKCRVDCSENIKYCPGNDIVNVTQTTLGEKWSSFKLSLP